MIEALPVWVKLKKRSGIFICESIAVPQLRGEAFEPADAMKNFIKNYKTTFGSDCLPVIQGGEV